MVSGNELCLKLEKEEYFKEDIEILKVFDSSKLVKPKFFEVGSSFSPQEDVKKIITKGWQLKKSEMKNEGKQVYNANLLRFEGIDFENGVCFSDKIEYKDVVGLRYWKYSIYNNLNENNVANALTLLNILITKDNKLIISKRNCGDWDMAYEICGGFIRANEKKSILKASLNRIKDDYEIENSCVLNQKIKAIYHYNKISETPMMIVVNLNIDLDEFFNLSSNKDLIFIDNDEESLFELLEENNEIILPSYYVLMVYLKTCF